MAALYFPPRHVGSMHHYSELRHHIEQIVHITWLISRVLLMTLIISRAADWQKTWLKVCRVDSSGAVTHDFKSEVLQNT